MDDYVVLAEGADDDYHRSQALYFDIQTQYFANEVDGVRSALANMQAVDPRRLTALQRWSLVCIASNLATLDGRWSDVVGPDPEDTAAVGITGGSVPLNHRFRALHLQGETDAALEALATMVRDHWVSVSVWPNDAWTSWAMGDLPSAATQLEAWHRDVFPLIPAAFRVHVIAYTAPVAVGVGARWLHHDFTTELRPRRGQWASWSPEVVDKLADHALGLLDLAFGDAALGEEELRTAVTDYRRAGTRAILTVALADLAVLTGDIDARTEALALADELGMKGVTARLTD